MLKFLRGVSRERFFWSLSAASECSLLAFAWSAASVDLLACFDLRLSGWSFAGFDDTVCDPALCSQPATISSAKDRSLSLGIPGLNCKKKDFCYKNLFQALKIFNKKRNTRQIQRHGYKTGNLNKTYKTILLSLNV